MYKRRKITRELQHIIDHILNDDIELALNMLKTALDREKEAKRRTDKR